MAGQESRDLPVFKSINSQGVYALVVTAGQQQQSVLVSGDDESLARLSTKVVGDELIISMPDDAHTKSEHKLTITIGAMHLGKLQLEGVGSTKLNQLHDDEFVLQYKGVGAVTANGKVQRFVLRAEGVGSIDARELHAQSVDARLQGVGSAMVRASESLTAKVEGVGSLTYYGNPKQVSKSADGIGSVRAAP
jgi:hypothetical protein